MPAEMKTGITDGRAMRIDMGSDSKQKPKGKRHETS